MKEVKLGSNYQLPRRDFLRLLLCGLAGGANARAASQSSGSRLPLFREVAEEVGLNFHHFTGATGEFYMPEIMGAGVALFDYDNDGDLDVYLIQGAMLDPALDTSHARFSPPPGGKPGNRLFRNLLSETGKLQFVDVTDQAGVGHIGYGMGVAVGDYDNDGFQDLYVTNFGHNVLYHNNGDGTFTDVTQKAGVDDQRWSTGAAWVDFDRDGRGLLAMNSKRVKFAGGNLNIVFCRDVVLLNAAAALVAASRAGHIGDALPEAIKSIDSGAAAGKLEALIHFTRTHSS